MPDKRPTKPFNLHSNPDQENIRDKDNVDNRHEPKYLSKTPAPNLAPPGSLGIKRGLPSDTEQAKKAKRFTIKKSGGLSKEFKSIVNKPPDKDRGWDR